MEKADLAQTPVLQEPQQTAAASRNNDGLEVLETREWLDSLDYVLARGGPERAGRLLQQLALHARRAAGYRGNTVAGDHPRSATGERRHECEAETEERNADRDPAARRQPRVHGSPFGCGSLLDY